MKIIFLFPGKLKSLMCLIATIIIFSSIVIINIDYFSEYNTLAANIAGKSNIYSPAYPMLAIVIEGFRYEEDGAEDIMSIQRHLTLSVNSVETQFKHAVITIDGTGKSKEYIKSQLEAAGEEAIRNGSAIAVGHTGNQGGEVTAQAIKEMLRYFDSKNIHMVFISELKN
jgi:polysaccharide deacetylase 2 family uncharacterized protein YibQ